MRRRSTAVVALSAVILALAGVFAGSSGAESPVYPGIIETAWWTDMIGASGQDKGMTVGASPDGGRSVGAVRLSAAYGLNSAFLDLTEVAASAPGGGGVRICIGPNAWQAVEQGDLGDAPRVSCDDTTSVPAIRDDATAKWSADLSTILAGRTGEVTVVLVPAGDQDNSGLGPVVPWSVEWSGPPAFAARSIDSPKAPPTSRRPSAPEASFTPTTAPSFRPSPGTSILPRTTTTVAELAETAATTSPPTTVSVVPGFAAAPAAGVPSGSGRPLAQALFFVVFSALVGMIASASHWFMQRPRLQPGPLGLMD
jgi:hypothetical protein